MTPQEHHQELSNKLFKIIESDFASQGEVLAHLVIAVQDSGILITPVQNLINHGDIGKAAVQKMLEIIMQQTEVLWCALVAEAWETKVDTDEIREVVVTSIYTSSFQSATSHRIDRSTTPAQLIEGTPSKITLGRFSNVIPTQH